MFQRQNRPPIALYILLLSRYKQTSNRDLGETFSQRNHNTAKLQKQTRIIM